LSLRRPSFTSLSELTQQVFQATKQFFDLSFAEKAKAHISLSPHYRGYGALQEELTNGVGDMKETYDFALEAPAPPSTAHSLPNYMKLIGPNQWPSLLSDESFRSVILEYIRHMRVLGRRIVRLFEMALSLPQGSLTSHFDDDSESAYSILRLLKYPPASEGSQGVGRHVDQGCLVILLQDDIGGLQVESPNGEWISAHPIPDTFIVNIGSSLEIWSDGYFVATPHKVTNPPLCHGRPRYSIPFFMEPSLTSQIIPFPLSPSLQNSEGSEKKRERENTESFVYGERMLMVYERSYDASAMMCP
jgi:isopenicillin N synthase-like dioxygenase